MLSVLFVASVTILCTCAYFDYSEDVYSRGLLRQSERKLNLNETLFPTLRNYRVGAVEAIPNDNPWIAFVAHSRTKSVPFLCTAVCIEKDIFITAARCVYRLKVIFTSVIYKGKNLPVKAVVVPSNKSKQLYDDIGFIITQDFEGEWDTIGIYDKPRPDEDFHWFRNLKFNGFDYKVIAYAIPKMFRKIPISRQSLKLVELNVVVDIRLCHVKFNTDKFNNLVFDVPCYHSCTYDKFMDFSHDCYGYVGVEGGALINKNTNILFGIATWGAYYKSYELPVGFSVPNSKSFYEDIKCARKIRENVETNTEGLYQRLCDDKRKYYEY